MNVKTLTTEQLTVLKILVDANGMTIIQKVVEFMMMTTLNLWKCVAHVNNQLDKDIWK